jgi:uncharacterized protein (DUF934 family)
MGLEKANCQAHLLGERYGYRGELRATGQTLRDQILRDQFLFLVHAGFDALDVAKTADVEAFAAALARYSVFYQVAGEGRVPVARRRVARLATATPGEAVH